MLDDINASDDVSMSFGGNPQELVRAAAAARRLGIDLSKLNSIAVDLLDFESSIESELEAQLLTGKQMNLSKARELALNNDLEGLANELAKNGASEAEFGKMNRIQQEALAKAFGMTRDQLAKVAYNALELGMTEDQAAAAAKSAEEMKRLTSRN
jgi:replication initiation and membrane attachment protein DnaB